MYIYIYICVCVCVCIYVTHSVKTQLKSVFCDLLFFTKIILHMVNQIKSLLLSHHHSTSALVSEILTSVLQTVQKKTVYIWTVHILRLYRRQCAKYTYIYSVHTVYYKDILRYQYTLHTVCTHLHYVHIYTLCNLYIVICEGATDYTFTTD